nr:hypothetical protein F5146DRAFT_1069486 [Armillaria mellea]
MPGLFSLFSCLLVAISVVQCAICGLYHLRLPIMHCFYLNFRIFGENGMLHTLFLALWLFSFSYSERSL